MSDSVRLIRSLLLAAAFLWSGAATAADAPAVRGDAKRGADLFHNICAHCHNTNSEMSSVKAPGLAGVTNRHNEAWLTQWIKSPEAFVKVDAAAKKLADANPYKLVMPTLPEMQGEQNRLDVIEFLKTLK